MVLLRIIILKLVLTICLSFSQTNVVWVDIGTSTTIWLIENQAYYFHLSYHAELEKGVTCSDGRGSTITLRTGQKSSTEYFYITSAITASQDMNGKWTCKGYYKRNIFVSITIGWMVEAKSLEKIIDVFIDVDECNIYLKPCGNNTNCFNTHGSYVCTCLPGYEPYGTYCQDVDECNKLSMPCGNNTYCTNTLGSFVCKCLPGYESYDRYSCQDVDECFSSPWPCSPNANCTNTLGSYECTCQLGYAGNGTFCETIHKGINLKFVVVIVVALVVVAAVIWLMVGLYKRRQRREKALQSELNYETLENSTERPMPTPPQWDNYSPAVDRQDGNATDPYSVPYQERNLEEMYAKPLPKALRQPPNESLYPELSSASVEPTDEPTYGNLSSQTAVYSQIQPKKSIGNANTLKETPAEIPYAEVLPKSMRPNNESSNYVNDLDTQRYVNTDIGEANSDRSEYVEPAYCEIGFKK